MSALPAQPVRTVYVVDDDDAVRDSLAMLFRAAGLDVEVFASGAEFLQRGPYADTACLVLDIRMPGMTGMMLQNIIIEGGIHIPIIFVTGHGDIPMAVEALKRGAYDFIEKPFDNDRLVSLVLGALESAGNRRRVEANRAVNAARLALLSGREREVLDHVLTGKPSRQIAAEMFISVKTVEFHRARIMQRLHVRSAAELFRVCLSGAPDRRDPSTER